MSYQANPEIPQSPEYNQQPVASRNVGVGPRFVAVLLDGLVIGIVGGILTAVLRNNPGLLGSIDGLIFIAYFIVMEKLYGATLGKMALGLRVVNTDGSPISWGGSVIRNLLRIIDGLFGYLVGAIIIWTSPTKQRLGDKVAHTIVIKK